MSDYLVHWGIKGMKWGKRRYQNADGTLTPAGKKRYQPTGLRASIARKQNQKVDAGFDKWKEEDAKKNKAIDLGKKANAAQLAYEKDRSNKELKDAYNAANKEYKKALGQNTTYRKGAVKKEVGQDIARKHLSEAKKVKKQLDADPSNKELRKKYNKLMSQHEIERADARRATEVATNRSRKKASIKRAMTMTITAAAGSAAVAAGAYAVNRYLTKHDVTLNGKALRINNEQFGKFVDIGKKLVGLGKYI